MFEKIHTIIQLKYQSKKTSIISPSDKIHQFVNLKINNWCPLSPRVLGANQRLQDAKSSQTSGAYSHGIYMGLKDQAINNQQLYNTFIKTITNNNESRA